MVTSTAITTILEISMARQRKTKTTSEVAIIPPQCNETELVVHRFPTRLLLHHVPVAWLVFFFSKGKGQVSAIDTFRSTLLLSWIPCEFDESFSNIIPEADRRYSCNSINNYRGILAEIAKWSFVEDRLIGQLIETFQDEAAIHAVWYEPSPGCRAYPLDVAAVKDKQLALLRSLSYVADKIYTAENHLVLHLKNEGRQEGQDFAATVGARAALAVMYKSKAKNVTADYYKERQKDGVSIADLAREDCTRQGIKEGNTEYQKAYKTAHQSISRIKFD